MNAGCFLTEELNTDVREISGCNGGEHANDFPSSGMLHRAVW